MPLTLRPLRPIDLQAYDLIFDNAFASGGLTNALYPNGYSAADRDHSIRSTLHKMAIGDEAMLAEAGFYYRWMGVFDSEMEGWTAEELGPALPEDILEQQQQQQEEEEQAASASAKAKATGQADETKGRLIGFSVWKIYPQDRTPQQLAAESRLAAAEGYPPTVARDVMDALYAAINDAKARLLGPRKHVLLHMLGTDPNHHRRGVGALQLAWGLGEADRLAAPAYLEASVMGRPLYARWGFEEMGSLGFDARAFGSESDVPITLMLRPAKRSGSGGDASA